MKPHLDIRSSLGASLTIEIWTKRIEPRAWAQHVAHCSQRSCRLCHERNSKSTGGADTNSTKESPSCPWGPLLREQCCPGMGPRETEESLEGIQNTAKQSAVAEMLALLWTKGWTTDLQQCRFLLQPSYISVNYSCNINDEYVWSTMAMEVCLVMSVRL